MAKGTFDGVNRLFIVGPGVTYLDAQVDLYSDWKEWAQEPGNARFAPMFRTVGGDPTAEDQAIGRYYFLLHGWRIRPYEGNHTLVVDGNVKVDGGGSPYVSTLGNFRVMVETEFSNQAVQVFTGGGGGGGFSAGDRAALMAIHSGEAPLREALRAAFFATIVDGAVTLQVFLRKLQAIIRGNATFDVPAPGTNRLRFRNQAGDVEDTHETTAQGRTVT